MDSWHQNDSTGARLADGTEFPRWEQSLKFTRTYYVDNGAPNADDTGPGDKERPFRTIGKAAELLEPGERVVIASGIYRECVRPARGGTGPGRMISYEAAPGANVHIRGSEILKDGWRPAASNIGRFQYTGQAWLGELGVYYYKARMYASRLGRFMLTDPIGYGDGLNWYNYVGSDPVNRIDPAGLACIPTEPLGLDCPWDRDIIVGGGSGFGVIDNAIRFGGGLANANQAWNGGGGAET